jgi:Na+/H+ antiporter NhaD/arsenite permease-like protein
MADFIWPIASIGILALIILIGVLLLWKTRAMRKEKKSGFPLADERTQKLNGKAAYYAMFICQYFILAYLWVTFVGKEFFGMPEIEAGYPLIAAVLVSALSFLMLRWHFGRKGEP